MKSFNRISTEREATASPHLRATRGTYRLPFARKCFESAAAAVNRPSILLILAAMIVPHFAADGQTLDSLIRRAYAVHPSIASARLSIDRAEAAAREAGAWEAPRAGVEFSMLPPHNPNPFSNGETMFMVEQEIPLFGQNRTMVDAMRLEGEIRQEELSTTLRELRARIATEYYRLVFLDRQRDLNGESRALLQLLYEDVETRYTVGGASQADLYALAVEIEELDATHRTIDIQQRTSQDVLNALLLQPQGDVILLLDTLPLSPLPPFSELVTGLETNPDLRKMDAMARMNDAEARAAESMLDPMLMLRGGVAVMPAGHPVRMAELGEMVEEFHSHGSNSVDRLGLMVGAMISIPVAPWSRSGPDAKAEAARLEGEEALTRKNGMRQEMIAMLRRDYGMAEEALNWIEHYRDRKIPMLEQTLTTLRNDYMNGRGTISSIVDTYRMLVMAKEEIVMREVEYATALVQIRKVASVE